MWSWVQDMGGRPFYQKDDGCYIWWNADRGGCWCCSDAGDCSAHCGHQDRHKIYNDDDDEGVCSECHAAWTEDRTVYKARSRAALPPVTGWVRIRYRYNSTPPDCKRCSGTGRFDESGPKLEPYERYHGYGTSPTCPACRGTGRSKWFCGELPAPTLRVVS